MIINDNYETARGINQDRIYVINVQNKVGIGGVERLVTDFAGELHFSGIPNFTFSLGRTKFTKYLLSNSVGRKILLFARASELLLRIGLRGIIHQDEKIILVCFHSECHLLLSLISPLLRNFPRIITVTYLCQSPEIYPPKLLNACQVAISSSKIVICYSTLVADLWSKESKRTIHSLHNLVRLERLAEYQPREISYSLNLIHIGRPVGYKAPESSLLFAIEAAKFCKEIKLTFVGIEKLENLNEFKLPENLGLIFMGLVPDTLSLTCNSTALLNLVDFNKSSEVIGVAAIESLSLGIPVVIHSMSQTGYSDLPGLITTQDFLRKLEYYVDESQNWSRIFNLTQDQITEVRSKVSSGRYLREFLKIVSTENEF